MGGYIGSKADRDMWVKEKVAFWTSTVSDLAFAAISHPQTAFAGLQKLLQHKWQFVQQVIEDIGDCFFDIEDTITNIFLPPPFGESLQTCNYHHKLAALPVKFAGLAIPDPSATSEENFVASTLVCSHLLTAFRGVELFSFLTELQSVRAAVAPRLLNPLLEKWTATCAAEPLNKGRRQASD
jgi:hypothetical protein